MMFKTCLALAAMLSVALAGQPWVAAPRDENWMHKHLALLNQTHEHGHEVEIVFLGDSITEGWKNNGRQVFEKHYTPRHAFNYGVGGDRTEHVLWRLQNNELKNVTAKVVVMMIGTNNISGKNSAKDIAKGVSAILDDLHHRMPAAKVLLLSVLPRATIPLDTEVHELNKMISRFADHVRVHWLDLAVSFEISLAHEIDELFVPDHLHLSAKGYEMWQKKMEPTLVHLLGHK